MSKQKKTVNKKQKHETFSLLKNGLDFIVSGLEAATHEDGKNTKYAVLHVWSGILLILKERIRQEHWSLLFSDQNKASMPAFSSGDFQGVNYEPIIKILKNICSVQLTQDSIDKLDKLRRARNKVEHFTFELSPDAFKSIVAAALEFIIEFIDEQLDSSTFDKEEKELLIKLTGLSNDFEIYVNKRIITVKRSLAKYCGIIVPCTVCGRRTAIRKNDVYKCKFCLEISGDFSQIANSYVEDVLEISSFLAYKDGGEFPVYICFDCGEESLVPEDKDHTFYICIACEERYSSDEVQSCSSCGDFSPNDDLGICYNCLQNKLID